jgi:hypothetical protein
MGLDGRWMGLWGQAPCLCEGGGEEWRAAAVGGSWRRSRRCRGGFLHSAWQTVGWVVEATTTAELQQWQDDEPTWHSQQHSTAQHSTALTAGTGFRDGTS